MKLLMENWRKFLKEEELIKENIGDFYDTLSEDDLYDLDIEDLLDLRDFIEDLEAAPGSRFPDPKDLYPTIMARIEAIEESEAEEEARVEDIYSGEYAMKLAKAYMGSAKMGIELAAMVPDAEGLAEEFKKLRGLVQDVLGHAERSDMAPWTKWDWNKHPNTIISSVGALINHLVDLPAENHWDMDELVDERKEILSMYYGWLESLRDLENYTFWQLAKANRYAPPSRRKGLVDSYHFIKDWVGEE